MGKAVVCMVVGLFIIGVARWLKGQSRKAEALVAEAKEIMRMDEDVDLVDGVDFCGLNGVRGGSAVDQPNKVVCHGIGGSGPPACHCDDKPLVEMMEATLVVDMWMVDDGAGNDVAYIQDKDHAQCFQEFFYPNGWVEFVETLETLKEV